MPPLIPPQCSDQRYTESLTQLCKVGEKRIDLLPSFLSHKLLPNTPRAESKGDHLFGRSWGSISRRCVHKLPLSANYLGTQWELFFLLKQLQSQYKSTIIKEALTHRRLLCTLTISRQQIKPQYLSNWVSISTGFHKKLIQVQVATTEKSMQHLKPAITAK